MEGYQCIGSSSLYPFSHSFPLSSSLSLLTPSHTTLLQTSWEEAPSLLCNLPWGRLFCKSGLCISYSVSVLRATGQPAALAHGGPLHSAPLVLATTLKQDFCKHAECWALQKTGSVFCDSITQHIQWEHSTNIGRVVLGISVFISFIPSI